MNVHTIDDQWTITYHKDGLLDVFVGTSLLVFAIGIFTGNTWLSGIFPAALVPIWISARSSLLRSRVKAEEVRSSGGSRRRAAMLALFTLTFLAGIVVFVAILFIPDWMHTWTVDLFLGLGGALLLGTVGLILNVRRFYTYAFLTVVIFTISHFFAGPLWLSLVLLSGIMILVGLAMLLRFLSEHPRMHPGE